MDRSSSDSNRNSKFYNFNDINMFQNIKVNMIADKVASNGKPYKALEVQDEAGGVFKVNIFNDFPEFANIKIGSVLRGQLVEKGQYTNLLSETLAKGKFGASGGYKQKVIEETMQRKENSIGKFQDNKEFSIMVASSMNGAIALACAEYKDKTVLDTLDQAVLKWRKFILDNWNIDPKDIAPF